MALCRHHREDVGNVLDEPLTLVLRMDAKAVLPTLERLQEYVDAVIDGRRINIRWHCTRPTAKGVEHIVTRQSDVKYDRFDVLEGSDGLAIDADRQLTRTRNEGGRK